MARRAHHEEHVNHEAWAIPYGDLITLLLAFFVVMYAISSVNEGKYRVLADALASAFGGPPRSITPIQLGTTQLRGSAFDRPSLATPGTQPGPAAASPIDNLRVRQIIEVPTFGRVFRHFGCSASGREYNNGPAAAQLQRVGERIVHALSRLARQRLVTVRRTTALLEVEIRSDILFASGSAQPSAMALATVRSLAEILRDEPNAIRVEGHTDDRLINTPQFPSNWELSAARAASVVRALVDAGLAPERLTVVGYGEQRPVADNTTEEGRNANRRVLLVILAAPEPEAQPAAHTLVAGDGSAAVHSTSAAAGDD